MTDPEKTIDRLPDTGTVGSANASALALVRLLDRYLVDLQAGLLPDRERLLAENPELAEQLAGCLDGVEFIHRAGGPRADAPTQLGEFRIVREIGRGGMGVVYEAEQTSLRRHVALKVLRFGAVTDEQALQRFQREAETVARLHHSNIVPIFALGFDRGVRYYVMQLIEGRSLADVLTSAEGKSGPRDPDEVARWGLQAAEALEYAHRRGVIHRDVKPSNLLLDPEGEVWLTDFGLARRVDEITLTAAGALLGTPRYMSPEQAESLTRPVDHRTDVYSLGATLYELATGRPVFDSGTPQGVLSQIVHAEPVPPRRFRTRFPRDLETILLTCLAKEPDRRYPSARALAEDLRAFLDRRPIRARRPSLARRARHWARKHRRSVAVAAITALLLIPLTAGALVGIDYLLQRRREARTGAIALDTAGLPLKTDVLDDRGVPVIPTFTAPTQKPVRVPEGSYRMRVSSPGRLTETFLTDVTPRLVVQSKIALEDRQLWDPVLLKNEYAEVIDLDGHANLLLVSSEGLRRLDGATAREVWRVKVGAPEWSGFVRSNQKRRPLLVRPAPDLDGDGTGDLVWSNYPATEIQTHRGWLLALSGRSGALLWAFEPSPEPPMGGFAWLTALGLPQALDLDGDGNSDLLASFASRQSPGPDIVRHRERIWVEAISGRTGQRLWTRTLVARERNGLHWHDSRPFAHAAKAVQVKGRPALAVVADNVLAVLDPKTGAPVWPVSELARPWYVAAAKGEAVAGSTRYWPIESARCLGDREPLALVVDSATDPAPSGLDAPHFTITAVGFRDGVTRWQRAVRGYRPSGSPFDFIAPEWPLVADLDDDGAPEVVLPDDVSEDKGTIRMLGLRVLGADGTPRWSRVLGRSARDIDHPGARMLVGPDLDGDRVREVFVAWSRGSGSDGWTHVAAEAYSGRDGHPLWSSSPTTSSQTVWEISILPLQWWRDDAAGGPRLLINAVQERGPRACDAFLLDARTGGLDHLMTESGRPQVADLDGDGVPDLYDLDDPRRVRAWRGGARNAWQRLGQVHPQADVDGDGVADLVSTPESMLVSGQSGRAIRPLGSDSDAHAWTFNPETSADLDGDGTPDVVGIHPYTREPILGAASGKTGRLLWQTRLGWPRDLFVRPYTILVRDLDGDGSLEIVLTARTDPGGNSRRHHRIAIISGRDGQVRWQDAISDETGRGPSYAFRAGVGDLNGDGVLDMVLGVVPPRPRPELVAFNGRNGARLWSSPLTDSPKDPAKATLRLAYTEIADLDADGRSEIVFVCWDDGLMRGRVAVFERDGRLRWSWEDRLRLFDQESFGKDAPLLVDLAGGCNGVGVVVESGEPGPTAETSFVVLDGAGKVVQRHPIALEGYHSALTRHLAVDLDDDGRDEQLLVASGRLRASRNGLETRLWERTLEDLGAEPASGIDLLGSTPGTPTTLVVVWTGRELRYLDGSTGRDLWRCSGPRLPPSFDVRPGFLAVSPAAGPPRGLFHVHDKSNYVNVFTVCRLARPAEKSSAP